MQFFALFMFFPLAPVAGLQRNQQGHGDLNNISSSACLDITLAPSGAFITVPIHLGLNLETVNVVADTGSTRLLVQERLATSSTMRTGLTGTLQYGSGDVLVEKCSDYVTIGSSTNNVSVYLMETYDPSGGFADVEGLLPLSIRKIDYLHTWKFSISLSGMGGALKFSADGTTSVSATQRWKMNLSGISGGGMPASIGNASVMADSGTTYILGPLADIEKVYYNACYSWSKCDTGSSDGAASAFVKAVEKHGCGNTQLPDITFNFGTDSITLSGWSYAFMHKGTCEAAFEYFDYTDFWILGLPLFYQYTVTFDTDNSRIGFDKMSDSSCSKSNVERDTTIRQPRHLDGPARWPTEYPDDVKKTVDAKSTKAHNHFEHVPLKKRLLERGRIKQGLL